MLDLIRYKEEVRNFYKPFYESNDKAHLIDHADEVVDIELDINEKLDLGLDDRLLILAGYIHDMYTDKRKEHHRLAFEYVMTTEDSLIASLTGIERDIVANAVGEHRASYKGKFTTVYSEVINAADKGILDVKLYVIRSAKYHSKKSVSIDDITNGVYHHMHDKFGKDGYSIETGIYKEYNKDRIDTFNNTVNILTKQMVRDLIDDNEDEIFN